MNKVQIITDSCSDLSRDLRDKYGIDYARMYTEYREKETPASLDFEYYQPKELYDIMRGGERVKTAQVPSVEFDRVFRLYLEKGCDIVYIGCSLKQSSSVNTGAVTAKEILKDYPDAEIYCIDSLNACMGEGMLAIRAAEYRDEGLSAKEINDRILSERNLVNEYCTVHSLDYMKRAGRIKASSAFFGNLLGVKPIIIADANGNQTALKKIKGREASLREIVAMLKETIVEPEKQTVYIAHADCLEEAEHVRDIVKEEINCKDVYIGYIGPIIGASIGPEAIAVFGFGKEVTV